MNIFVRDWTILILEILRIPVIYLLSRLSLLLPVLALLQVPLIADAQQKKASVRFMEREHNFGTFRESEGVVTHQFRFVNEGGEPLVITDVISDCGCTVSAWTADSVAPGMEGTITLNYDPADRPGTFVRPVTVISNAVTPEITLVVKGVVIPVDMIQEVYRYKSGDIMFSSLYASFGEILMGSEKKQTIRILNTGEETVRVGFAHLPSHLALRQVPEILAPGAEGVLEIGYITDRISDWDYVVDRLKITVNGVETGDDLNITANIREDFSKLTSEDLINAPVASFETTIFNFGTVAASGQPVDFDFILTNRGRRDLIIRKITASCGCTAVEPDISVIVPGASARITAVFNPSGQGGSQKKAVTVITNDPRHSKSILWIEGNVDNITSR